MIDRPSAIAAIMPGPVRAAVQEALLGGAARRQARRRLGGALAGGDRQEDRVEALDRRVLAADHQAVAAVQAPDAAAGADVHVVQAVLFQRLRPGDVVQVVRVAAVDHHIVGLQQRDQLVQGLLHDPGRHHDPDVAGLLQLGDELGEAVRTHRAIRFQTLDRVGVHVIGDAAVAVAHQPADEVGAHPAESDHPQLHRLVSWHLSPFEFAVLTDQCVR
jgi:hypothetical protein